MKNLIKAVLLTVILFMAFMSITVAQTFSYKASTTKTAEKSGDITIDGKTFDVYTGSRGGKYIQYTNGKGNVSKVYMSGVEAGTMPDGKKVYEATKRDGTKWYWVLALTSAGNPKKLAIEKN